MSTRAPTKPVTVARCVLRRDGVWLVLSTDGDSATSSVELPEGTRITIKDGKAYRPK